MVEGSSTNLPCMAFRIQTVDGLQKLCSALPFLFFMLVRQIVPAQSLSNYNISFLANTSILFFSNDSLHAQLGVGNYHKLVDYGKFE